MWNAGRVARFQSLRVLTGCLLLALAARLPAQESNSTSPQTTDPVKQQADQAYRDGDYLEVERLLNPLLADNPKDDIALYLRASARVERGAEEQDTDVVRAGINDARAALSVKLNVDYYLPYLFGMSRLAEIENRPEHARSGLEVAQKVLARSDLSKLQRANISYQCGLLHIAVGDNDAARQELVKAISSAPDHVAAHSALCDLLTRTATPQEAEAQFDRSISAISDEPLLYNNRGAFLQSLGRYDEAQKDFSRAIELDDAYVPAWTSRGFGELLGGNYTKAESDLTRSLHLDGQQPAAYGLRGAARLHQGNIQGAIQDYQTAVSLAPNSASAYYDLGFAHFFNRDYSAARDAFDQAVRVDPKITFLGPWRYMAMTFSGHREQALQEFASIENKPADQRNWFDMAILYLMGKSDDAALLAAVTKDSPQARLAQECEAYFFIGMRLASRQQPDQAKSYFEKAIATGARHLSAYRGAMYAVGKFDR